MRLSVAGELDLRIVEELLPDNVAETVVFTLDEESALMANLAVILVGVLLRDQ